MNNNKSETLKPKLQDKQKNTTTIPVSVGIDLSKLKLLIINIPYSSICLTGQTIQINIKANSVNHFSLFQVTNLTEVLESEPGIGKTPYDPSHNSTAILTAAGDFYGATNLGPDDRDPAIYRKEGIHTKSKGLRTAQSNSMWLNGKWTIELNHLI